MPAMIGILAEETLEAQAGQVFLVGGDGDAFLDLDRLMQPVPPGAVGHHAAGEFVDDLNFAIFADQILLVANKAVAAGQRLRDQFFAAALALPEVFAVAQLFEPILPAGGEIDLRTVRSMVKSRLYFELAGPDRRRRDRTWRWALPRANWR